MIRHRYIYPLAVFKLFLKIKNRLTIFRTAIIARDYPYN